MANETVSWLVEKRVMYVTMEGEQSRQSFEHMNDEMFRFLEEGEAPVHVILDVSQLKKPYLDISLISKKSVSNDKRIGLLAIIGAKGTIQFVIKMVGTIIKSNYHLVASMEEGIELIREKDSTVATV
jgi:hypothetical protein